MDRIFIDLVSEFCLYIEKNLGPELCFEIFPIVNNTGYNHFYEKYKNTNFHCQDFFCRLDYKNKQKLISWYTKQTGIILPFYTEIDNFFRQLYSYIGPYLFYNDFNEYRIQTLLKQNEMRYDYMNLWRNLNDIEKDIFIDIYNTNKK